MIKPSLQNKTSTFLENQSILLQLRPSQVKFPSDNLSFEVCKLANFTQGYLNRQIIILLHSLGVPANYFFQRQSEHIMMASLKNVEKLKQSIKQFSNNFGYLYS